MIDHFSLTISSLHGMIITSLLLVVMLFFAFRSKKKLQSSNQQKTNTSTNTSSDCESVNYHFTRQCNYACKFCFHTAKTSFVLDEETAKRGLKLLEAAGMKKINFSGGEPFTKPRLLGNLVKYCKETLKLESVTIVSNGSLISEDWFKQFSDSLDILAISCDSFNEATLTAIGRHSKKSTHIQKMKEIRDWCTKYNVLFKINTVVTSIHHSEDMNHYINELKPSRWKVFQCLLIEGENVGEKALRDARQLVVSKEQFDAFIERHKQNNPIPENNIDMKDSYLLLDEQMRFLNCQNGGKEPSNSILDVGVEAALDHAGFDQAAFIRRGGKFEWSKQKSQLDW